MLSDLKEIDNKMDLNNQVKQILKEEFNISDRLLKRLKKEKQIFSQ